MMIATLEQPDGHLASPVKADMGLVVHELLKLLPFLLLPCVVAVGAGVVMPSLPVALGASVGVTVTLGICSLASCLLSMHPMGLMQITLCAAAGAGSTIFLWRSLLGSSSSSPEVCLCFAYALLMTCQLA